MVEVIRNAIMVLFDKGGWLMVVLMVPIIGCSVMAVAIIIERFFFFLSFKRIKTTKVTAQIFSHLKKGQVKQAHAVCEETPYFLTNILKAGIYWWGHSKDVMKESMENASLYELPALERNLIFLSTLAHVSPLMGLLGTVVGLIRSFYIIELNTASFGTVNPSDIAGGIWVALLTTVAGLSVAILCYIAYNYFVHKVDCFVLEAEKSSTELLELAGETYENEKRKYA